MKIITIFLSFLLLASSANSKERVFIASTPAADVVRSFLGINLNDSVDFIRWKLKLTDKNYTLSCNYGISKPNTNGFTDGGKKIELNGVVNNDGNYYGLKNGTTTLYIVELNNNLLHLLSADKKLLVGDGGWSYTLNNSNPSVNNNSSMQAKQSLLKDSLVFDGRTPCNVPRVVPAGQECYKLKWRVILYAIPGKTNSGHYKILGTAWRRTNGQTGNWTIMTDKNNRTTYELSDDKGNKLLYLLKVDENILFFTDATGNLLTGNEDFSYTLNRK